MSAKPPAFDCDDPTTWQHKDEKIDLPRLLELIEKNGGPQSLDLHGADLSNIDARPETLRPHIASYLIEHGPDATFPWLTEKRGINLRGAHLEYADLPTAHLENADLSRAHLNSAKLPRAHLEHAHLPAAHLEDADLSGIHLEHAELLGAHLENAMLVGAHLQNADLSYAHLERAHLNDAHLQKADLLEAHLEYAHLPSAHLENTSLSGAHLEYAALSSARLQNAQFSFAYLQNADLRWAHLNGAIWSSAHLDRTRLRREELGPAIGDELAAKGQSPIHEWLSEAREAYMALKTNFDSIGRYEDASWAYIKEQQMEKAMYFPTTAGHTWIRERMGGTAPPPWWGPGRLTRWLWWKLRSGFYHTRLFFSFLGLCPRELRQEMARRDEKGDERDEWLSRWRWGRNWAYELLTGYGERPWNPVIIAAASIAAFAVGYWATAAVRGFWDAVAYSIATFATFNLARPATQPQGLGVEIASAVQAMLGISLFALFVFTLGNRMRRS